MQSPLFTLSRGSFEEIEICGELVVHDGASIIYQTTDGIGAYPARSLLKPFQFLATGLSLPTQLKNCRFSPAVGSISATQEQMEQLRDWYSEDFLKGIWERILLKNISTHVLNHPCFSKHLAILEACTASGWKQQGYTSKEHPYHASLVKSLGELLNEPNTKTSWVEDGCGLPTPVLSLSKMASLFQKLANPNPGSPLYSIQQLMLTNPQWVGGTGRLDTDLMEFNPLQLVAKEGADGLLAVAILPGSKYPHGLGIVLKLSCGYIPSYLALAITPIIEHFGLKSKPTTLGGQTVRYHYSPRQRAQRKFYDISPTLCSNTPVFPGDTAFKRTLSLDIRQGDHLTLSHFSGTLHLGSHVDSPIHYDRYGVGIDKVSLDKYVGYCQVIGVTKPPGTLITFSDLAGVELRSNRILFKTNSFLNADCFSASFSALSAELIEFLAERKVILVGIDTPSIDPADSKELPAHHATIASGMAILEQISLEAVPEGLYELICLPLKIEDGDASPVRAVLRK